MIRERNIFCTRKKQKKRKKRQCICVLLINFGQVSLFVDGIQIGGEKKSLRSFTAARFRWGGSWDTRVGNNFKIILHTLTKRGIPQDNAWYNASSFLGDRLRASMS